ncbi:MAG: hypothetical protein JW395_0808 [Nitrospira sp.]|nr:hypothetical protein [Nitrospira sp.]
MQHGHCKGAGVNRHRRRDRRGRVQRIAVRVFNSRIRFHLKLQRALRVHRRDFHFVLCTASCDGHSAYAHPGEGKVFDGIKARDGFREYNLYARLGCKGVNEQRVEQSHRFHIGRFDILQQGIPNIPFFGACRTSTLAHHHPRAAIVTGDSAHMRFGLVISKKVLLRGEKRKVSLCRGENRHIGTGPCCS